MAFNLRATRDPADSGRGEPLPARSARAGDDADGGAAHAVGSRAASTVPSSNEPDVHRLETLFRACFEAEYATVLEGGGAEPLYIASHDPSRVPHRVVYREDYFASALHEIAHWCIAGAARRRLDDYGYWYDPDGRTVEQQRAFESVEARPQALEWIFSEACGHAFHLSADNLEGGTGPSPGFAEAVARERRAMQAGGLPPRAARFLRALQENARIAASPDHNA